MAPNPLCLRSGVNCYGTWSGPWVGRGCQTTLWKTGIDWACNNEKIHLIGNCSDGVLSSKLGNGPLSQMGRLRTNTGVTHSANYGSATLMYKETWYMVSFLSSLVQYTSFALVHKPSRPLPFI